MEKLVTYVKHSLDEWKKVIFPTRPQIGNAFISVFVVVTVITLFLGLIDLIMHSALSILI